MFRPGASDPALSAGVLLPGGRRQRGGLQELAGDNSWKANVYYFACVLLLVVLYYERSRKERFLWHKLV